MARLIVHGQGGPGSPAERLAGEGASAARKNGQSTAKRAAKAVLKWCGKVFSVPGNPQKFLGWPGTVFIVTQLMGGIPLLGYALFHWHPESTLRFACFLGIALSASLFKVQLPGIPATMSVNFLFILVGILDLSLPETLIMGCLCGLTQSIWKSKPRPRLIQLLFNFANLAISIYAADLVFHSHVAYAIGMRWPLLLAAASTTYFAVNTLSVSGIIAMSERRNPMLVWKECYLWTFPYYLLGALIASLVGVINRTLGWQVSILVLPIVYWIYRSYRIYLDKLEGEKRHSDEVAALHLRTIEALSLAIEAKDHTTHDHLKRVETYAVQFGEDLGLSENELNALRAASLLHDIGKLAVPEQILSKPGRLTPEEFERMKIHPVVGAEILNRVQFPYPVVPIVRSHHERWNGQGYPDGLRGEGIPIGARILSVADCFDALTSERPYRRALSIEEALNHIRLESGKTYDPRVVACLEHRYVELEERMKSAPRGKTLLSLDSGRTQVEPASGAFSVPGPERIRSTSFLASIVSARQEAQLLFDLAQTMGNSLSLRETLSVVAVRLKEMIPHDGIVFYVLEDQKLIPRYVHGTDYELFRTIEIPLGQGISGWVAQNQQPIINGDPATETQYLHDPGRISALKSALSVPLPGREGVAGVLTLYLRPSQGFSKDHLRLLLAASTKLGISVENASQFEKAADSASTDFLTGLPNARSICSHLEKEISRSRRGSTALTVLLCDLNGFKAVNDGFGHLVGNRLLQEIANKLKTTGREYDLVGRLGGDEFVFILSAIGQDEVEGLKQRIELAVKAAGQSVCQSTLVTVSVGCAFYPQDGFTAEDLLAKADEHMYAAKEIHYQKLRGDARQSVTVR